MIKQLTVTCNSLLVESSPRYLAFTTVFMRYKMFFPVTYNGRMRQIVYLDATGITTWNKDAVGQTGHLELNHISMFD